jgi:SAM-dependent methyltransferase
MDKMGYFKELYCYLPRAGPGDGASTRRAFAAIERLPAKPRILDIGCGPGVQTLELLRLCDGAVTALDLLPEMIKRLKDSVQAAGFADRVVTVQADMNEMSFEPKSFDLIWSEGAIYLMGFRNGLSKIRPLLKPGGYAAVSEAVWLKTDPPEEAVQLWKEYPEIDTVANKLKVIAELEYDLVEHFTLPPSSWTDFYYDPLEERIREYQAEWSGNGEAERVLEEARNEISVFRRFPEYYSYAFFVMRN